MVQHKMFITFLQGITLFLITTCKARNTAITLDKIDSNGFQLNVNAPLLRKNFIENLELFKFDKNSERGASYVQEEINKNFGHINDTNMKVNVNLENFGKPVRRSKESNKSSHPFQPSASDTKTASLTEAISEIDVKLKKYRKTVCNFDPPIPDFASEGHRTSQAKCLDYIWDIKLEEEKRNELCKGYDDSIMPHIVSGNKVHAGDYPHMGAIGWAAKKDRWIFLCGSSLISDKFVLTVAHCHSVSREYDNRVTHHKPKIVRFGVVNIKTDWDPVDIKIRRFISYEKYDYTVKYNDIALIELEDVVRFTENIRPACLWNKFSFHNVRTAAVTGWGVSDSDQSKSQTTSPNLQVARIDIIDYKKCRDKLEMKKCSDWSGLARHQMCAGKLNGTASACEGDSGGPLQIRLPTDTIKPVHSIIGLTSVGFGCGMTKFPSIYTRVSSFIEWIEKEVWGVQDVEETLTPYIRRHHNRTYNNNEKHTYRYSPKIESKYTKHRKHWYHHPHGHQSRHHNHN